MVKKLHNRALEKARTSPCVRRKYGVAIGHVSDTWTTEINTYCNSRVCDSCNDGCIRTKLQLRPGERTEVGAEVHAEQAALIDYGPERIGDEVFFLAGYDGDGQEIPSPKPCPTCAKMMLYAGFKTYYTLDFDWTTAIGYPHHEYKAHSTLDLVKAYEMELKDAS